MSLLAQQLSFHESPAGYGPSALLLCHGDLNHVPFLLLPANVYGGQLWIAPDEAVPLANYGGAPFLNPLATEKSIRATTVVRILGNNSSEGDTILLEHLLEDFISYGIPLVKESDAMTVVRQVQTESAIDRCNFRSAITIEFLLSCSRER